jgi:hypothetical protein
MDWFAGFSEIFLFMACQAQTERILAFRPAMFDIETCGDYGK